MSYPTDLKYTKEHEWARLEEDGLVRIGVTTYAVEQLGDVTLVDLPEVGDEVSIDGHLGDIESVKTVSELFSPIGGEIVAINETLDDQPESVNDSPYNEGWMVVIKPNSPAEIDRLWDAGAYEEYLGKLED